MKKLKAALALSFALAVSTVAAQAQTRGINAGETTVNLASGFVSALTTLKVKPSPLDASQLAGTVIDFPIVSGAFDTSDATSEIVHSGGLRLTTAKTVVDLRDFIIETGSSQPTISGLVLVNGKIVGRVALFNLSIKASDVLNSGNFLIVIDNVGVSLTDGAASTLDSVFGTTAIKGGTAVGTATVVGILSNL